MKPHSKALVCCVKGDPGSPVVEVVTPRAPPRPRPAGLSPCSRAPCYPGVRCFESIHISAGFACGPCPPGLHGNGQTCSNSGESCFLTSGEIRLICQITANRQDETNTVRCCCKNRRYFCHRTLQTFLNITKYYKYKTVLLHENCEYHGKMCPISAWCAVSP